MYICLYILYIYIIEISDMKWVKQNLSDWSSAEGRGLYFQIHPWRQL